MFWINQCNCRGNCGWWNRRRRGCCWIAVSGNGWPRLLTRTTFRVFCILLLANDLTLFNGLISIALFLLCGLVAGGFVGAQEKR